MKIKKEVNKELRAGRLQSGSWVALFYVSMVNFVNALLGYKIPLLIYLILAGTGAVLAAILLVWGLCIQRSIRKDREEELRAASQKQ